MRNEMNRTSSQSKTSEYQRTRPRREKTGCRVRASSHGSPEPDLGRALALLTRTCARPPGPQPQACQAQLWGPPCPSPAVAAEARAWTPLGRAPQGWQLRGTQLLPLTAAASPSPTHPARSLRPWAGGH